MHMKVQGYLMQACFIEIYQVFAKKRIRLGTFLTECKWNYIESPRFKSGPDRNFSLQTFNILEGSIKTLILNMISSSVLTIIFIVFH